MTGFPSYLAPDLNADADARAEQQRLRDRLRDTLTGRDENKVLEPIEDNMKDVTRRRETDSTVTAPVNDEGKSR